MLRMAEDERDHYKRECEIMRSISRSRPNSRASSPIRAGSPDKVSIFFLWGIHDRFQQRTSEIMSIVGSPVLVPRIQLEHPASFIYFTFSWFSLEMIWN